MDEVLLLVGTRPEAVKVAPVAVRLAAAGHRPLIVHSGQHVDMVEQALAPFGLRPDVRLSVERGAGGQAQLVSQLLPALDEVLVRERPAVVVVQGDTTTALAGALTAFWRRVPVAHLEAGLRTGDLDAPFPEEANRQMIARIAALHLAPTDAAAAALSRESLPSGEIVTTGNTVVDAVLRIAAADLPADSPRLAALERELDVSGARLVLMTAHRRESWGAPLAEALDAVSTVVRSHADVRLLFPLHPNPALRAQVIAVLGQNPQVVLTDPLSYPDLVRALRRSSLVLTDSGGIQEEAPSFGVPVLVLRDVTERMEAVDVGCAWLVGTNRARILTEAERLLNAHPQVSAVENPFGDGRAAERVCAALTRLIPDRAGMRAALVAAS
jgi:UDP-N-acetylglucosamine 2-epimerase (non-hydrolysing)